jgi:hypothetical protein
MTTSAEPVRITLTSDDRWLEVTPGGERFRIRTSTHETEGFYSTLEIVAPPRSV